MRIEEKNVCMIQGLEIVRERCNAEVQTESLKILDMTQVKIEEKPGVNKSLPPLPPASNFGNIPPPPGVNNSP